MATREAGCLISQDGESPEARFLKDLKASTTAHVSLL
jgi:hypothetical protein